MKRTNQLLILITIISLMACNPKEKHLIYTVTPPSGTSYSGKIHEIILYVNTTDIVNPDIARYANFRQPYYVTNEDYTTYVNKGDIIIWKGISVTDTLDVVNITSIKHHDGREFFGKKVLKGNGDDPEIVIGVIKNGSGEEGTPRYNEEKYKIKFTVTNNGRSRNGTFIIDPKLIANN